MMARNIWLILTFTFFGPLVGALVELLLALAVDPILSGPDTSGTERLLSSWPFILSMGYALGLAPAFVAAIIQIIATRWLPSRAGRLIAATLIGAVTSTVLIGAFMLASEMGSPADLWFLLLVAVPGGVAALLSLALVELFHPLPRPA